MVGCLFLSVHFYFLSVAIFKINANKCVIFDLEDDAVVSVHVKRVGSFSITFQFMKIRNAFEVRYAVVNDGRKSG